MRFHISAFSAILAVSLPLATAAPVENTVRAVAKPANFKVNPNGKAASLTRHDGKIPADMDTSACKFYSTALGEWTYEARIRTMENTEDICKKLEDEIANTVPCTWNYDWSCDFDSNDPMVTRWKFKAGQVCDTASVSDALSRATGQDSDNSSCWISFDGEWPPV